MTHLVVSLMDFLRLQGCSLLLLFTFSSLASIDINESQAIKALTGFPQLQKPHVINCILENPFVETLPTLAFIAVLRQEAGKLGGASLNKNKTRDYGIAQINDVRKNEVEKLGYTLEQVRDDACIAIEVSQNLIYQEIQSANNDLWKGIGNYHSDIDVSKNKNHHHKYTRLVLKQWMLAIHFLLAKNTH